MIIQQAHKLALTQPIEESHLASLYAQDPFPYLRFLLMPEIIDYAHIAKTSRGEVALSELRPDLVGEIEKFIPDGFKIL